MSTVEPDSVRAIAKKDFQDAVRSYLFWGLSAFFFALMAIAAYLIGTFEEGTTTQEFVSLVYLITSLVIPLIALFLGWKAIAGERETGSIRVLLSLPHSRKDMILGKLFGRVGVLTVSLLVGFVIAGVIVAVVLSGFSFTEYGAFLAMTVLYGLAYTSIAITVSTFARSTWIAAAAAFGVFVLFYVVWNSLEMALQYLMWEGYISGQMNADSREVLPDWALFIYTLDPGNAYQNTLAVFNSSVNSIIGAQFGLEDVPFYLQDWFSFVVLLFWIVVPIGIALYQFDRVDL